MNKRIAQKILKRYVTYHYRGGYQPYTPEQQVRAARRFLRFAYMSGLKGAQERATAEDNTNANLCANILPAEAMKARWRGRDRGLHLLGEE